jgi:hypothetical protein
VPDAIRAAAKLPCFDWEDQVANPASITFDFVVRRAMHGDIGFDFWILSTKATANFTSKMINTITVHFAPHPTTLNWTTRTQ